VPKKKTINDITGTIRLCNHTQKKRIWQARKHGTNVTNMQEQNDKVSIPGLGQDKQTNKCNAMQQKKNDTHLPKKNQAKT